MKTSMTKSKSLFCFPILGITLFLFISTSAFASWPLHHKKQKEDTTQKAPPIDASKLNAPKIHIDKPEIDLPPEITTVSMRKFEGSNFLPVNIIQVVALPRHIVILNSKTAPTPIESVGSKEASGVPPEMVDAMLSLKLDLDQIPKDFLATSQLDFKRDARVILTQGQTVTRASEQINSNQVFCALSPKSITQRDGVIIDTSTPPHYDRLTLTGAVPKVISISQTWYSSLTFFFSTPLPDPSRHVLAAQCLWPNKVLTEKSPAEMVKLLESVIGAKTAL